MIPFCVLNTKKKKRLADADAESRCYESYRLHCLHLPILKWMEFNMYYSKLFFSDSVNMYLIHRIAGEVLSHVKLMTSLKDK